MYRKLMICICMGLGLGLGAQEYNWSNSTQFFSPNYTSYSVVARVDVNSLNEKVVIGQFRDSLNINNQTLYSQRPIGMFMAKYSPDDSLLWVKKYSKQMI